MVNIVNSFGTVRQSIMFSYLTVYIRFMVFHIMSSFTLKCLLILCGEFLVLVFFYFRNIY